MPDSPNPPVALVTGSGKRRLGYFIAEALGARGYCLAIHYRSSSAEAAETVASFCARGFSAEPFQADLADEAQVHRLVAAVLDHFGRIDVLVNTAAIWSPRPLEQITARDVRDNFEANTLSTFLMSQRVGLAMVAQPSGGSIVNFGDWAEARPYLDHAAYFPSKGAIPTLTRCLAVELGTRNPSVRVNAILPGAVMLPHELPSAERQEAIDATLVRREGSPEAIVQAALYLIDNAFVTGTCMPVDGGRTIYAPKP